MVSTPSGRITGLWEPHKEITPGVNDIHSHARKSIDGTAPACEHNFADVSLVSRPWTFRKMHIDRAIDDLS